MQPKATALIQILQDALHRVDEDAKLHPDPNDPATLELRNSILRGILDLQRTQDTSADSQAA